MAFDPSRIPGLEPLTRDYMIAFDRVAAFYGGDPHDLTAYDRVAARVDARCLPRAATRSYAVRSWGSPP